MKRMCVYLVIIFTCVFVAFSCRKKEEEGAPASSESQPGKAAESLEPSAMPPSMGADDNSMMASVNGKIITRAEVNQEADNLLRQFQGRVPPEQMNDLRSSLWKQALENKINTKLLLQKVDQEKIQADKKDIDEQIEEIESHFPSSEKFHDQLAAMGISEKKLRQDIEENLKIRALLDQPMAAVKEATEKEVEAFYSDNPDEFENPEQVQASHILIAVSPDDSPKEKEEKFNKLSRLRDEIEKGADFAQVARQHSDCPSKERGGDLGYFERGKMVKPFEDVAFKLKKGELSEIVETQFGYHLIKVTGHQDAHTLPLNEVKEKIASFLSRQKEQQAIKDYILELRNAAKIEYSENIQP